MQTARNPYANQMYRKKPVAACVSWQVTYIGCIAGLSRGGAVAHRKACLTLRLGTILSSIGKKRIFYSSSFDEIVLGLNVNTVRLKLSAFIISATANSVALRRLQPVFHYQPNCHLS
jgi:hypothetical protein